MAERDPAHPSLQTWNAACTTEPVIPAPAPNVSVAVHKAGDDLFKIASELTGLPLQCVVTVSARVTDASVRWFATALAVAMHGKVLTDLPMVWDIKDTGERIPPVDEAWRILVQSAADGVKALAREKAEWKPDPDDDWSDVS